MVFFLLLLLVKRFFGYIIGHGIHTRNANWTTKKSDREGERERTSEIWSKRQRDGHRPENDNSPIWFSLSTPKLHALFCYCSYCVALFAQFFFWILIFLCLLLWIIQNIRSLMEMVGSLNLDCILYSYLGKTSIESLRTFVKIFRISAV